MNKTELYRKTVYQLFLRAFTKEGTLRAAKAAIPEGFSSKGKTVLLSEGISADGIAGYGYIVTA